MGGSAKSIDHREGLSVLQMRLEAHFAALRSHRDEQETAGLPLFALEHGLDTAELSLLKLTVCEAIRRRHLAGSAWLPYVVYAAEIGYEYSGDEYWQTFTRRTPGWPDDNESRNFIRDSFRRLALQFGGAQPSGAWANHFTIICWPITHAVLPTDLQRQLAQLLHDYRTALTSDLLSDPAALGARLATRTFSFSSRFQNFAQNTALLGQVATALYLGTEEQSPYLLTSTLTRIVDSLSAQKQARLWLSDARRSASHVRAKGFVQPGVAKRSVTETQQSNPARIPRPTDPEILLQASEAGWQVSLRLPDLSPLADRLPELHDLLTRRRVRVAGRSGAPLATRRLLVAGQSVPLDDWPNWRAPLLQFEGDGVDAANRLLAEQCMLSPGPLWLFRVQEPGRATEVRGKFVRPGRSYVILAPADSLGPDRPSWIRRVGCVTAGVSAYTLDVPDPLSDPDIQALQALCLSSVASVVVRPVGLVAKEWDGEGAGEWLAGEDVLLAISSERAVAKCGVVVDGEVRYVDWPVSGELLLGISGLDVGMHEVKVTLLSVDVDSPALEGSLVLRVQALPTRPSTGTIREGLMLLASPSMPTLSEIWDGRAVVELVGPPNSEVGITATLRDNKDHLLAQNSFKAHLPLDPETWLKTAKKELYGSTSLRQVYDEAHILELSFNQPGLGAAQLRCEREFAPLRWVLGSDRDGYFARLVNNVEGATVQITRYPFASPAVSETVLDDPTERLRWARGGLLRAAVGDYTASVILPPQVRHFDDIHVRPFVANTPRTIERVQELIALSSHWVGASLPADPFAKHDRRLVLRALTMRAITVLAGGRWSHLEEAGFPDDEYSFRKLERGVGDEAYQKGLADAVRRRLVGWLPLEPLKRAQEFAGVLAIYHHRTKVQRTDHRFAELLLRLASEPATLAVWPASEIRDYLKRINESPVLIRVSRFVVLGIHIDENEDIGTTFRGWAWT